MSSTEGLDDRELHDRLSALLDGELSPAEDSQVRAYVARSPLAQADLDDIALVRGQVRALPEVDAPFGFYETVLARRRRPRRYGVRTAGVFAAAAAAIVIVLGVTPVGDTVVPPVNAFAERHMHMITPATVVERPPVTSARGSSAGRFDEVPAGELDHMGAPSVLAGAYSRMGGYRSDSGVLHLMYASGSVEVSVYEQVGAVAWDSLPSSGTRMRLGNGDDAWAMTSDGENVMVVERNTTAYTVVAVGGHDEMVGVVEAMPAPPTPSLADRAHRACRSVVKHFGFG